MEFRYGTVTDIYGDSLEFDFPFPEQEEGIYLALEAVNSALNGEDTPPTGAGEQGTVDFFIGYNDVQFDLVTAVGGEIISGYWGLCVTDCIDFEELQTGVGVKSPFDFATWAEFTVVE